MALNLGLRWLGRLPSPCVQGLSPRNKLSHQRCWQHPPVPWVEAKALGVCVRLRAPDRRLFDIRGNELTGPRP